MHRKPFEPFTRRDALATLGTLGVMSWVGSKTGLLHPARAAGDPPVIGGACTLTPELTIGPYFVDEGLNRSDLRAGTGSDTPFIADALLLHLTINVTSALTAGCPALAAVQIDIWHCHAGGLYSDEAQNGTTGQTWLRGYQVTDANGSVSFTTIYPGWYAGRTIHIHVMARYYDADGNTTYQFTTQLFFDEAANDTVMANYPYDTRGNRTTTNQNDGIYDDSMLLDLRAAGDGLSYTGTIALGLELEATAQPDTVVANGFESA
jgi:protocatechuate 3,4-dioxygenase beta subunit